MRFIFSHINLLLFLVIENSQWARGFARRNFRKFIDKEQRTWDEDDTRGARNNLASTRSTADNLVESWRRRGHDRAFYEICQSHRSRREETDRRRDKASERERKREKERQAENERRGGREKPRKMRETGGWWGNGRGRKEPGRETGNELMKEFVALMRVNPLPLFYTTRRHALCVKVGNSRRAFIFALVANAKLNPRYSHLADIDRRERSGKIITLSRRTYRRSYALSILAEISARRHVSPRCETCAARTII